MFHKPDDVKEFDKSVLAIRFKLESSATDEIACDVLKIMRSITWHDWTTDCPYMVGLGNSLQTSDANLVRQFADACVLFLDRPNEAGIQRLQKQAATYLEDRGIHVVASNEFSKYYPVASVLKALGQDKDTPMPRSTWQLRRKALGRHIENHPTSGNKRVRFTRHASEFLALNLPEFKE